MNGELLRALARVSEELEETLCCENEASSLMLRAAEEIMQLNQTVMLMGLASNPAEFFRMRDNMLSFEKALQTRDLELQLAEAEIEQLKAQIK